MCVVETQMQLPLRGGGHDGGGADSDASANGGAFAPGVQGAVANVESRLSVARTLATVLVLMFLCASHGRDFLLGATILNPSVFTTGFKKPSSRNL